jgi:Excalibur calcium-binding domain
MRLAALLAVAVSLGAAAAPANALIPPQWKNCKAVNARYPHGVGKLKAHDATDGDPVTNFKRSTTLYLRAMHYNRGLDRDKDGIACEKH